MTPEQLKASILQYAVEGKLVKQNPNDEPASELIKKIENEKAELVKEGKIKKSKKLPAITDEDKLFDIPDSWKWVRLGNITNFVGTGMVVPANQQSEFQYAGMLPYFKMNNIGNWNGKFGVGDWVYIPENEKVEKYFLKSGQLLFNTRNSKELVGKTTVVPDNISEKIVANNNILRIESFQHMKLSFVSYYLISPVSRYIFSTLTTATTNVAAIYQKQLKEIVIPIPPLEEQKRIVTKIEKLMPLVDEYAESYNRLQKIDNEFEDKLKQSVLQYAMEGKLVKQNPSDEPASELIKKIENEKAELVKEGKIKKSKKLPAITDEEKPFDIPDSWEWVRLGIISEVRGGKRVPRGMKLSETSSYCPYIRVTDMENNSVAQETLRYATKKIYEEISRYIITSEDVYFSIAGTIGKVGIVPCNLSGALLTENAARLTPYYINKKFMVYLLSSPIVKNQHRKILSKVAQPKLSLIKLKRTIVPLPPLEEQKRIVLKINKLQEVISGLFK